MSFKISSCPANLWFEGSKAVFPFFSVLMEKLWDNYCHLEFRYMFNRSKNVSISVLLFCNLFQLNIFASSLQLLAKLRKKEGGIVQNCPLVLCMLPSLNKQGSSLLHEAGECWVPYIFPLFFFSVFFFFFALCSALFCFALLNAINKNFQKLTTK